MSDSTIRPLTGTALLQPLITGATPQESDSQSSNLGGLPTGSLINGFVINRDRQSNPILRTEYGDVLVKSDVFLKTGSEVTIRVETLAAQSRARIVRVDNQSIQELIHLQSQQGAQKDDVVLQPSITQTSSKSASPDQVANNLRNETQIVLEAVLLKPSAEASNVNSPEALVSTVLKIPAELARAVLQGQGITLRIVSSDLNIVATPAPATASIPTATTLAGIAGTQYQAYSQQSSPAATQAPPPPLVSLPPATPSSVAASALPQPVAVQILQNLVEPALVPPIPAANAGAIIPSVPGNATPPAPQPTVTGTPVPLPAPTSNAPTPPVPPAVTPPLPAPLLPAIAAPLAAAVQPIATEPQASPAAPIITPPSIQTIAAAPIALPTTQPIAHTIQSALNQPSQNGLITALVIGSEKGGETIVRTSIGIVKLFTATPPPVGSTLQLEWVAGPTTPFAPALNSSAKKEGGIDVSVTTLSNLGQSWDSLKEALQLLQSQPQFQAELAARIPNTKSKLVNDVLFFVSAMKSGDIRTWLGNKLADKLEEKSPGLLQRLGADFAALKSMNEQPNQSWQINAFPIMHEDELHQARLFIRQDDQAQKNQGSNAGGVRFLVECSLSQIGEMQLDGFVRKQDGRTGFDLVVRSQHPMDETMTATITTLFHEGAATTGYVGQIRFQHHLENFIRPLQNITFLNNDTDRSIIA